MPIPAWVSPLGISFGHQVADDAKTGSGTTEKHDNQGFLGELAGEPGFSHDFKGLTKKPLISFCFSVASDRGCHLCALALGRRQHGGRAAIISGSWLSWFL
ncbi:MAG: hypothetical protein ACK4SQ_10280 [Allorhizobium sp.]